MNEGSSDFGFQQVLTSLKTLNFAFVSGVSLYGAIAVFAALRRAGGASTSPLWIAGFAAAGAMVVVGYFVGRVILARRTAAIQSPVSEQELGQAYFASKILSWAMIEGGGMMACTLILLSGNWTIGLQVVVLAVIGLLLTRARREDLEALLRGAHG